MFKFIKSSLIIIFIITLTACSYSPDSLKEIYNKMGSEMAQDLKAPFDLSAQQSAIIDDYTKQLFIWHRRHKLPEYAQTFAKLADLVSQDNPHLPSLKKALDEVDNFPHIYQATHLTHKMEAFARSMTNTQISQLEQLLKDGDQEEALEIKNQNYVVDINDMFKESFRFIGTSLNAEQLKIINTKARKFHDIRHYELQAEKQWNKNMIALLRHKSRPDFSVRFAHYWKTQNPLLTGDALQLQKRNNHLQADLMKTLIMKLSPAQKEKLTRQLTSISNTFTEMANE